MDNHEPKIMLLPSRLNEKFDQADILDQVSEILDRNGPTALSDLVGVLSEITDEMAGVLMQEARFPEADVMRRATRALRRVTLLTASLEVMEPTPIAIAEPKKIEDLHD